MSLFKREQCCSNLISTFDNEKEALITFSKEKFTQECADGIKRSIFSKVDTKQFSKVGRATHHSFQKWVG